MITMTRTSESTAPTLQRVAPELPTRTTRRAPDRLCIGHLITGVANRQNAGDR
jgi:hypothetical protein